MIIFHWNALGTIQMYFVHAGGRGLEILVILIFSLKKEMRVVMVLYVYKEMNARTRLV